MNLLVLALILAISLVALTAGCEGSAAEEQDTAVTADTGTAASDASDATGGISPTTIVSTETLVVNGRPVEEYEAALPELEETVAADHENLEALQKLAIAQLQTGRYQEAAATYERMLAIENDAFTRNNYGNVLRKWGKTDEAKAEYERAIAADPTLAIAYVNLATILSQAGDESGALEILESGVQKVADEDKTSLRDLMGPLEKTKDD